jgi:hypothetical protein
MTNIERLIVLRRDISPQQEMKAKRQFSRKRSGFWLNNALAFNWHSEPCWMALASFKYAERLRRG